MAAFNFVTSSQPRPIDRFILKVASANKMLLAGLGASRPEYQFEIMSNLDMTVLNLLDPATSPTLDNQSTDCSASNRI